MASWKPGGGARVRSDAAAAGRQERPSAAKAHASAESTAPPAQATGANPRAAARVEAPPPSQDDASGVAQEALDDIAASRRRMQEALGRAQHRSNSAAVKVQKVFRGRAQRRALESWLGASAGALSAAAA